MKHGKCPLCLEEKPICESHLVPAAIYKYCWHGDAPPVRFTADEIGYSEEELTAYLLCQKCEQRLNRDGENWLAPKLARREGHFPFHALLTRMPPDIVQRDFVGYACGKNPKIGFRKLINFSIGVFWKASIHPWNKTRRTVQMDLGKYREEFRLFLLRKAKFPVHAALTVTVAPPERAVIGFNVPELRIAKPVHQYVLNIPGITFTLLVGKAIPEELHRMCFASNPLHYALVADLSPQIIGALTQGTRKAKFVPTVTPRMPPRKER